MSTFKPLLASPVEFDRLDFTNLWVSPKLDGIRAIVINGVVVSRKLLPIPNMYVQELFGHAKYEGLDGELIVGDPTSKTVYNETYSGVMKATGEPEVVFHVFDEITNPNAEYHERYYSVMNRLTGSWHHARWLEHDPVGKMEHLLKAEEDFLRMGYEGVMLRAFHGPKSRYKFGRSTAKEGTLMKLKRFSDKEALIVDVEEEMANMNEATTDELGHTKRSSHQDGKVGKGRLGALVCVTPEGVRFNIGTGFDAKMREKLWRERPIGKYAKYKSFDIGAIDAPRFPVFLGLREPMDM